MLVGIRYKILHVILTHQLLLFDLIIPHFQAVFFDSLLDSNEQEWSLPSPGEELGECGKELSLRG